MTSNESCGLGVAMSESRMERREVPRGLGRRTFAIFGALAVTGAIVVAPATAGYSEEPPANPESSAIAPAEQDLSVVVTQMFDHAVTVEQAIEIGNASGSNVEGVRVENPEATAEYSLLDGLSLEDFLAWFQNLYGTEPQAVGILVRVDAVEVEPPADSESLVAKAGEAFLVPADEPEELATGVPEFVAEEPVGGEAYEYFSEPDQSSAAASTGAIETIPGGTQLADAVPASSAVTGAGAVEMMPGGIRPAAAVPTSVKWAPSYMELRVERYGTRQYFYQFAAWKHGSNPAVRPQRVVCNSDGHCTTVDFAMEFGIDVYNRDHASAVRPFCSVDENDFLAKNESFTWGVSAGQTDLKQTTEAYHDWWEIADSCEKNTFTIGLAKPWNIPANANGYKQILVSINAPVGLQSRGQIGGSVTLNDDYYCQPNPSMDRALCMGDALLTPAPPYQAERISLNPGRGWWASPNKCWLSGNSGTTYPAVVLPHDYDGCF
ncbi:hypothetical protein J7E29_00070 [Streptomyces sp. ISL-90]|nr:hypothetical protein [Streptomyces sp. ISL-90]